MELIKKIGKIGFVVLSIAALLIVLAIIVRAIFATVIRNNHAITEENGIDEEVVLSVGGIKQYLYIRGHNIDNPVILFLHGGPGGSMTGVIHAYQYPWEQEYTVVNWDQRVSGKTYWLNQDNAEELAAGLSADLLLNDLHEIVLYLNERFGKKQVILVGHSWGSVLGSQFALKYPELIAANVGVGQTINITDGIITASEYFRSLAENQGNEADRAAIDELINRVKNSKTIPNAEALEIYKIGQKYTSVDLNTSIFTKALLSSPYYSLRELSYYGKMSKLTEPLIPYLLTYDLNAYGSDYKVPVIYMLGDKDWNNRITAEKYFEKINAPYKEFVIIKDAGHTTMLEQPNVFFAELSRALKKALASSLSQEAN
jgi:pimeloyl-ACP methyl ester carboxylesterase